MIKVMVIDGNRAHAALIKQRLEGLGMSVLLVTNPLIVAYKVGEFEPDVILVDYKTGSVSGDKVISLLKKYDRDEAEIALMSDDDTIMPLAAQLGICYLDKDTLFQGDTLEESVFRLAGEGSG
jgi:CheY-like chemotaxis protein